ncbi:SH3 and PX domain-containing protein 2B [Trichoplax sp. H2]|nr:SH3 and PX domain-containing protein 2B [Trichoplax sp. H2]|eukprot:RDD42341.1 SH3 and PX domain-containing protein 2B [Trichoplax sp. H2]
MVRRLVQIEVLDVEKRHHPSKHYVYVMEVFWSDDTKHIIYRRYSQFFDLQVHLLDHFPTEAGSKNPSQRTIPYLPGKKLFVRSHTYETATGRIYPLRQYCKALIKLPDKISLYDRVLKFFEVNDSDLNPTGASKDTKGKKKGDKLKAGDPDTEVDPEPINIECYRAVASYKKVEKNELKFLILGWWFVTVEDDHGWVPASYLEKINEAPDYQDVEPEVKKASKEIYVTTQDVEPGYADEIPLPKGTAVEVLQKSETGWWLVKVNGKVGWAPRARLERPVQYSSKVLLRRDQVEKKISEYYAKENIALQQTNPGTSDDQDSVDKSDHSGSFRQRVQSIYMTADEFESNDPNCVSFSVGATAEVVEKCKDWWYVKISNSEGWAPASYIDKTYVKASSPIPSSQTARKGTQNSSPVIDQPKRDKETSSPRPTIKARMQNLLPASINKSEGDKKTSSPKMTAKAQAKNTSSTINQSNNDKKLPPPKPARSGIVKSGRKNSGVEDANGKNPNDDTKHDGSNTEIAKPQIQLRPVPHPKKKDSTSPAASPKLASRKSNPSGKHKQSNSQSGENPVSIIQEMRSKLKTTQTAAPIAYGKSSIDSTATVNKPEITKQRQVPLRPKPITHKSKENGNSVNNNEAKQIASSNPGNLQDVKATEASSVSNHLARPAVKKESYRVLYEFSKTFNGTIDVKESELVNVIEKNEDGWWLVRRGSDEGFVPGNYLEAVPANFKPPRPPKPKPRN